MVNLSILQQQQKNIAIVSFIYFLSEAMKFSIVIQDFDSFFTHFCIPVVQG